jgi:hypothetical protein
MRGGVRVAVKAHTCASRCRHTASKLDQRGSPYLLSIRLG